jgi:hypothetical protein
MARRTKRDYQWLEDSDESDHENNGRPPACRAVGSERHDGGQGRPGGRLANNLGGSDGNIERRNRGIRLNGGRGGAADEPEPRIQNSAQEEPSERELTKSLRSTMVFLTYSQVDFTGHSKECLVRHLKMVADMLKVEIKELVVAHERHADGGSHYHAWVKFNRRVRHQPLQWKWEGRTACVRTNIKSAHAVIKYCKKDGDYIQSGIDMSRYTDCVKNHKRYIGQRVLDAGELTTELIDEHPEILYDISRINEGLDYYNIRKVAERTREEYKPEWKYFYNWQAGALDYLSRPPTRAPYWMVDESGNHGKSAFATFLDHRRGAILLTMCDARDVCYIIKSNIHKWNMKRRAILVFDFPRDYNYDNCYSLIEAICNGFIASTKYAPTELRFERPHVIVFSNTIPRDKADPQDLELGMEPPPKAWTDDRWANYHVMDEEGMQNSAITSDLWEGEARLEPRKRPADDTDRTIDLTDPKWSEEAPAARVRSPPPLQRSVEVRRRRRANPLIDIEALCSDEEGEISEVDSVGSLGDFIVD